ncbi:MAG TPA: DUF72 domain-containing protein, partial [Thermoleophilaceae bacterium]|nr:DUF72 domain-containing protein [Thermoleophilaceae bacterium]
KAARVGCSGWNYRDWRGDFYPEGVPAKRWLEAYAERFDTVEVNTTFYRLAKRPAVERWVEQTPPGFTFTVKASRYMTHMKRLRDLEPALKRFYEPLRPLADAGRLGPVLWQLPGDFERDDERLAGLLGLLPEGRHALEFRHPSWFAPAVLDRLRDHGVALVIGDHPERPFQRHELTADWTLVRFHWGRRGRRGNYSDSEIATWARRLAQWRRRADVYAYFNNDWEGFAPRNALTLAARLRP